MYALFINVSLLSQAIIFRSIHKSFHKGSITITYWLIFSFFSSLCIWKWLILAISYRFPHLTRGLLLPLTVSCGSERWGLYLWPTIKIGKRIKKNFPGSQWTFKWIIDWKTEKWSVAWVNVIAILASAFQKAWTTLQIMYDRSPVCNLLFARKKKKKMNNCSERELSAYCRGQFGDVGTCKNEAASTINKLANKL